MRHNRIFRRSLAVLMSLALCAGMVLPALAAVTVTTPLTCKEAVHTHTDECYEEKTTTKEENVLTCTDERHVHTDECYQEQWVLVCTQQETDEGKPQHVHSVENGCYKEVKVEVQKLICAYAQEHTHDAGCYEVSLTCSETPHTHGEGCYDENGTLTCEVAEHTHGDSCYSQTLKCAQSEHTHDSSCYETEEETRQELDCQEKEGANSDQPVHKHGDGCYEWKKVLVCEEQDVHEHTDDCYTPQNVTVTEKVLICEQKEHVHTADCYADKTAEGQTLQEALKEALNGVDKEVTLILNGKVLEYAHGDGNNAKYGASAIVLDGGMNLTIEDAVGGGGLHGDGGEKGLIRLIYVKNGTVNLNGGTLSGGNHSEGGAVYVDKDGTFNMNDGTIKNNIATTDGGGVYVNGGTFNMNGGAIQNNHATDSPTSPPTSWNNQGKVNEEPANQGGGVYVTNKGTFNLKDGTIANNTAGEGGGVFVYNGSKLVMTGGTVSGNVAYLGEGGGLYIGQGESGYGGATGTISSGTINKNVTYTFQDLGGGGVYVESGGKLYLTNVVITNNTANGLGGGIAGCIHGKTIIYVKDGAAVYGNHSEGTSHVYGHYNNETKKYNGEVIDAYNLWSAQQILKDAGQDIFTAGNGPSGNSGIIVSNSMLGDVQKDHDANWSGYTYCYVFGKDGKPIKENDQYVFEVTEVTHKNNGTVFGNRLLFLTANPSDEAIQNAIAFMQGKNGVIISDNLSANSHGGGLANNGTVIIGTPDTTIDGTNSYDRPELEKTLISDNKDVTLKTEHFTFELLDAEQKVIEGAEVTSDENGYAKFDIPNKYFDELKFEDGNDTQTLTFYVREVDAEKENFSYDHKLYKVTITVTMEKGQVTIGDKKVNVETMCVGDPVITIAVFDEEGNVTGYKPVADGIQFTNTYTTPPTPTPTTPTPTPTTPGGDETPDPTPTPSQTPTPTPTPETPAPEPEPEPEPEPLPDPEVPLNPGPEEPVEEIPGPDVPLAPAPEEPLEEIPEPDVPLANVEIPDEEVPLAEVPKTGDISLLWYVAAAMSACGLAVLGLRKKTRS